MRVVSQSPNQSGFGTFLLNGVESFFGAIGGGALGVGPQGGVNAGEVVGGAIGAVPALGVSAGESAGGTLAATGAGAIDAIKISIGQFLGGFAGAGAVPIKTSPVSTPSLGNSRGEMLLLLVLAAVIVAVVIKI